MHQVLIKFPEINLKEVDEMRLRDHFAKFLKRSSPLLLSQMEDVTYPVAQLKVMGKVPLFLGVDKGAETVAELFSEMDGLEIDGRHYPIHEKDVYHEELETKVHDDFFTYEFLSPWLSFNKKNLAKYKRGDDGQRQKLLSSLLVVNILNFFNAVGHKEKGVIQVKPRLEEVRVRVKEQSMTGFTGIFATNVRLPNFIGLGKMVAGGFGAIREV